MRSLLHLGLAGIAVWQFTIHYDELVPSDRAQRWALHECFVDNHRFDPLNRDERQACFKEKLSAPRIAAMAVAMPPMAMRPSPPRRPNFVDLRRAAGQRRTGPHDIRAQQEGRRLGRRAVYRRR